MKISISIILLFSFAACNMTQKTIYSVESKSLIGKRYVEDTYVELDTVYMNGEESPGYVFFNTVDKATIKSGDILSLNSYTIVKNKIRLTDDMSKRITEFTIENENVLLDSYGTKWNLKN